MFYRILLQLEKKITKSICGNYVSFESIELGFSTKFVAVQSRRCIRLTSVKFGKCLTSRIELHTNAKKDEK